MYIPSASPRLIDVKYVSVFWPAYVLDPITRMEAQARGLYGVGMEY